MPESSDQVPSVETDPRSINGTAAAESKDVEQRLDDEEHQEDAEPRRGDEEHAPVPETTPGSPQTSIRKTTAIERKDADPRRDEKEHAGPPEPETTPGSLKLYPMVLPAAVPNMSPSARYTNVPDVTSPPDIGSQPVDSSTSATTSQPPTPGSGSLPSFVNPSAPLPPSSASLPPASPAPRRPPPPKKGILKPPPPPPKPTFGNRLRDLAANVVGTAPVPQGAISGRGAFEGTYDTPTHAHGGNVGLGAAPHGSSPGAGPSQASSAASATPSLRPAEQRLQEVSAAVGGTLNALGGKLGMGFNRLLANTTGGTAIGSPAPSSGSSHNGHLDDPASVTGQFATNGHTPLSSAPAFSAATTLLASINLGEKTLKKHPLKRATFVLPSLSIVYPISTYGEPWSVKVMEDRKRIENSHKSLISATTGSQYWSSHRLVLLYETACKGREERSRVGIVRALESLPPSPRPRSLHLLHHPFSITSPTPPPPPHTLDTPLTKHAAQALADVLSIEWGLTDLKLEGGVIEDDASVKSILHGLLISGTLPVLSLKGNRRIRGTGWGMLADFLKKATLLRYLDLSDTIWDKRGMDYLAAALSCHQDTIAVDRGTDSPPASETEQFNAYGSFLPPAPLLRRGEEGQLASGLQTLRMDGCNLRSNVLESLANGIRTSEIKNLSLRGNRIGPQGGVALAVMLRDYSDGEARNMGQRTGITGDSTSSLLSGNASQEKLALPVIGDGRISPGASDDASSTLKTQIERLEGVKRVGKLLTLDLKANDLRNGVQYIAQVLKRNRTLKVLNLCDNKIDSAGLFALAEALKYNSSLETIDLSSNPCCGPSLEGVFALRAAFTRHTSLKRLFLSDTGLTSEGAIALAEFLPETKSILHLDITSNPVDADGILAISTALRSNTVIRCLDLSIPPNDPDLAEMSQGILQLCIRNTELAAGHLEAKAADRVDAEPRAPRNTEAIWAPIKRSTLVKQAKEADDYRAQQARIDLAQSTQGLAREYVYRLSPAKLVPTAERTGRDLEKWLEAGKIAKRLGWDGTWVPGQLPKEDYGVLKERAVALVDRLVDEAQRMPDGESPEVMTRLMRMIELKESLEGVLEDTKGFSPPPRLLLPSQIVVSPLRTDPATPTSSTAIGNGRPPHAVARHRRHIRGTSLEISSPNFSIGDSDNDSDADAEEVDVDVSRLASSASRNPAVPGLTRQGDGSIRKIPTGPPVIDTDVHVDTATVGTRKPDDTRLELLPGDETDAVMAALLEATNSPQEETQRSKRWVEEEGEVFRKSTKLGVVGAANDDGGQASEKGKGKMMSDSPSGEDKEGDVLKQEILDTEVARDHEKRVIPLGDDDDHDESRVETK